MPDEPLESAAPEADGTPEPADQGQALPVSDAVVDPSRDREGAVDEPAAAGPVQPADGADAPEPLNEPVAQEATPEEPTAVAPEPAGELPAEFEPAPTEPEQTTEPGATAAEPAPVAAEPEASASADAGNALSQDELDALSAELSGEVPLSSAAASVADSATTPPADADAEFDKSIAEAMAEAIAGEAGAAGSPSAGPAVVGAVPVRVSADDAKPFASPELSRGQPEAPAAIDLLDDVQLDVKIELGRTNMYIEDVLRLGVGSVVELDKLAGDPVDIYVNERLIARGEVLVLNDNFCVRINAIHSPVPELEPA